MSRMGRRARQWRSIWLAVGETEQHLEAEALARAEEPLAQCAVEHRRLHFVGGVARAAEGLVAHVDALARGQRLLALAAGVRSAELEGAAPLRIRRHFA